MGEYYSGKTMVARQLLGERKANKKEVPDTPPTAVGMDCLGIAGDNISSQLCRLPASGGSLAVRFRILPL